ncbi:unnamed protein product [Fraxinus pennsylvanica]|uniref:NADP-dependent oxidoreductase domain-containing protein n=1 Tax=Fraxinus pennsylvanica TaxID=56036 RepID=A0AAD1Z435_9LAMI|nr:unnamed protein product [Fraxinus pennsylvanica]
MAIRKGCIPSRLALAWIHHQGTDVCPIPGTSKFENLNKNIEALFVKLTKEDMAELESRVTDMVLVLVRGSIQTLLLRQLGKLLEDCLYPKITLRNGKKIEIKMALHHVLSKQFPLLEIVCLCKWPSIIIVLRFGFQTTVIQIVD